MKIFDAYSRYYDLLYRDKDYKAEAQYIHELIQQYAPGAEDLLELGCGTCTHAAELARKGYRVHGVDSSPEMLARAKLKLDKMPSNVVNNISNTQADIRNVRLPNRFDAVIALFHVMSYLPTNDDIRAALETAKIHLMKTGILVFDCWYGPAVLTQRPTIRVKRMEDEAVRIVRIAEPFIYPNDNLVEVKYEVFITNKENGAVETIEETHRIRYLFKPEIDSLLAGAGFTTVDCLEFMGNTEPGLSTWSVLFIGRR